MKILITGAAGFVGSSLTKRLSVPSKYQVIGVDNFDPYYSVDLKKYRKESLLKECKFYEMDINSPEFENLIARENFSAIIHLAAQPGIRLGIERAEKYLDNNVSAFVRLVRLIQRYEVPDFLYASSSSVYGDFIKAPFDERETALEPRSLYGITKLMNEQIARAILGRTVTRSRGLRFFTVYGPWGRPDMAYFRAIASATKGTDFTRFGDGQVQRDFTYIDDITESIESLLIELNTRNEGFSDVVNIGGGQPVTLNHLIELIEHSSGNPIRIIQKDMNAEDSKMTCASFTYLNELSGKSEFVKLSQGLISTLNWFTEIDAQRIRNWIESSP